MIKNKRKPLKASALLGSLVSIFLCTSTQVNAAVGQLLWQDNFNTFKNENWHKDVGDGCDKGLCGWGNQELQWYSENNIYIDDIPGEPGNKALVLEARDEASNGYAFTSGKVESSNKVAVQYGMIEVRMQVPNVGIGLWPAAWMLGTSAQSWPAKGEIDIMEMGHKASARADAGFPGADINSYVGSNLIFYADAACSEGNPTCAASTAWQNDNAHVSNVPLTNRFVTYRTYWTDTTIRFTVEDNGIEYDMYDAPFTIGEESSEFQAPFYLLLNLAVGGNFTDAMSNNEVTAVKPAKMYIDYVRIYELDGQGQVFLGNQTQPEAGTFGIFTDNTPTNNKLVAGQDSDIYVWNQNAVSDGNILAAEGDNVIAWHYTSSNEWFGGGINARQVRDLSNFNDNGELSFKIKIPADVSFKVGIADTYTNQNWVEFPANTTKYGLVRNGDWATATIPAADIRGDLVAMQSLEGMFYIASVDGQLPSGPFQIAIDDIVWTGGGDVAITDADGDGVDDIFDNCAQTPPGAVVDDDGCEIIIAPDTDNDGVDDAFDLCPNTPVASVVDTTGCPLIVAQSQLMQAEDYTNFSDTTANNIGGQYRTDAVDIEATSDTGGGYNVGWIEAGETLDYTLELGAGSYEISTRVASATRGDYTLILNGHIISSDSVATGGWQTFQTHHLASVDVTAGEHTIRISADSGNFNVNWINLELTIAPLDADNDGVVDDVDNCPTISNSNQANFDGDTFGDACDSDKDADGVDNGVDQCEFSPLGSAVEQSTGCEELIIVDGKVMINEASNGDVLLTINLDHQVTNTQFFLKRNDSQIAAGAATETANTDGGYTYTYVVSADKFSTQDIIQARVYYFDPQTSSQVFEPGPYNPPAFNWQGPYVYGDDTPVDSDNDSIIDNLDNCPNTANTNQANFDGDTLGDVCDSDSDNDGVVNGDQCQYSPLGSTVDPNTGCPVIILDADNDTILDSVDNCPITANANQANFDGDALGDACDSDSDNDGVVNGDQCQYSPLGSTVDQNTGCPAITAADGKVIIAEQTNGDILLTVNLAHQVSSTQFFLKRNNSQIAAGAATEITNSNGSFSYTYLVAANNFAAQDVVQARVYYFDPQTNQQVFEPGPYNPPTFNWQSHVYGEVTSSDSDNDGINDDIDNCPNTANFNQANSDGDALGDVCDGDVDGDGVNNGPDQCPATPVDTSVDSDGCPLIILDSDNDTLADAVDNCPNTANTNQANFDGDSLGDACDNDVDNDGIVNSADQCAFTALGAMVNSVGCVEMGSVTPLYNSATVLEGTHQIHTDEALITRYGDRPRTRHAKEDQFQRYDHYIAQYFQRRSSSMEIIDRVAKGGDSITLNVRTVWPISTQREGRIWYMGWGTIADYIDNSLMEIDTTKGDSQGFDGTHFHYTKTVSTNPRKSPTNLNTPGGGALGMHSDSPAIEIGDLMEFEVSQFSGTLNGEIIGGQTNYYGSTFLYVVGKGIVPWYTINTGSFAQGTAHFQEDSRELPEKYRLGGGTTQAYQYTHEPDNYFMQMALNIDYDKSQKFLEGRRVFHSSFDDGQHDEFDENGKFDEVTGLIGGNHVNQACADCHVRNGAAPVEANGVPLERWVFKIGDSSGAPDADRGRVLQPSSLTGFGEGKVSIAQWTELSNGLRTPTFEFESGEPAKFSARISPRLVGLGLLEAIKETDILALEQAQANGHNGVSGRANLVADPKNPALTRIGRFGWKASTVSVEHQVASALNTDMGVKTSLLPELDCGSVQQGCDLGAQALDATNVDKLVYYVQALAVRAQRGLESGVEDPAIDAGKQVFIDTGCADCHTPSFQTSEFHPLVEVRDQAIQPYTDLLVHDMGDGLADSLAEGSVSGREWRTTPLWGLGLSMCVTNGVINPTNTQGGEICNRAPGGSYLHDGRARTIEEAILWHGTNGSEALHATNNYKMLSASDKANLHSFLESL